MEGVGDYLAWAGSIRHILTRKWWTTVDGPLTWKSIKITDTDEECR